MSGLFSSKGLSTKDKTSITTFKHQDLVLDGFMTRDVQITQNFGDIERIY